MSKHRLFLGIVAIAPVVMLVAAWQAAAQPTDNSQSAQPQQQQSMQCPMMAMMKDVEVYADSPVLLLAQSEKLNLTDEQKQQIRQAEEDARQKARQVLKPDQQQQLAEAPDGQLSMKEVGKLLHKGQAGEGGEMMCPMCMKMMQQQSQQSADERSGHEGHHKQDVEAR